MKDTGLCDRARDSHRAAPSAARVELQRNVVGVAEGHQLAHRPRSDLTSSHTPGIEMLDPPVESSAVNEGKTEVVESAAPLVEGPGHRVVAMGDEGDEQLAGAHHRFVETVDRHPLDLDKTQHIGVPLQASIQVADTQRDVMDPVDLGACAHGPHSTTHSTFFTEPQPGGRGISRGEWHSGAMTRASSRLAVALGAVLLTAGCGSPATRVNAPSVSPSTQVSDGAAASLLAAHGLTGKTPEQVIEALDRDRRPRPLPLKGSVRSDKVVLTDGATEVEMPLSSNRFYLSIAPYASRTHECYFHNLGTCQGELVDTPVHVTITDAAGATLVDSRARTYANGFVGFWVPKNTTGTVTVTTNGKTGSTSFDSKPDGATCVTTLKVA